MTQIQIEIPKQAIEAFCSRWQVSELALFGSVLREDFTPNSDIDVLISFPANVKWNLFDLGAMQQELEDIFQRSVDVLPRHGVERIENTRRKQEILESARVIHAA